MTPWWVLLAASECGGYFGGGGLCFIVYGSAVSSVALALAGVNATGNTVGETRVLWHA